MSKESKDSISLVMKSWADVKREFKQCHRVRRATYKFLDLLIVLVYAVLKMCWVLLVDWYKWLFKWARYTAPSIPYISSRL